MPALLRKRSPDGATPKWGSRHPIAACYLFINPKGMKGWVGLVGWPIADGLPTSGHTSATGRAQDRESSPAKDRPSTAVPHNQPIGNAVHAIEIPDKPTSCSLLHNLPSAHFTHTHRIHLPIPLLSLGKRTEPLYGFSTEVQSRLILCLQ